jgi:hypothetical protein
MENFKVNNKSTEPSLNTFNKKLEELLNNILTYSYSTDFVLGLKNKVSQIEHLINVDKLTSQVSGSSMNSSIKLQNLLELIMKDLVFINENNIISKVLAKWLIWSKTAGVDPNKAFLELMNSYMSDGYPQPISVRLARLTTIYNYCGL